jgi:hypothetical protein
MFKKTPILLMVGIPSKNLNKVKTNPGDKELTK